MNASMTVDGGPPVFFVPPIQTAAVTTNNLIFNSGDLSAGTHTLVVTAENDHTVWSDYFLVTPNPASTSSVVASSSSSSSTTTSTSTPSKKSTPVAAIAASVVGVLVLIALIVVFLVFLRRRKRQRETQSLARTPRIYN
jgi:hypothetical protein